MNYPTNKLRNIGRFTLAVTFSGILMISCKKNDSADDNSISDDDIAEVVTQSVSANSGGLVQQTESSATLAAQKHLTCGETRDTTITGTNISGAAIVYSFSQHLSRTLNCTESVPSMLTLTYKGKFVYATPRMSSNDSSYANTVITGLEPASSNIVLNQNYVRKGSQQSLIRLRRSFTSTITITSTNITVSKATRKIISGTANIQFEGKSSGGLTITRGGTIIFEGNQQAKLKLNNGIEYPLSW